MTTRIIIDFAFRLMHLEALYMLVRRLRGAEASYFNMGLIEKGVTSKLSFK